MSWLLSLERASSTQAPFLISASKVRRDEKTRKLSDATLGCLSFTNCKRTGVIVGKEAWNDEGECVENNNGRKER
jgi:hypothetical protein